jgi:hypothetical protein
MTKGGSSLAEFQSWIEKISCIFISSTASQQKAAQSMVAAKKFLLLVKK